MESSARTAAWQAVVAGGCSRSRTRLEHPLPCQPRWGIRNDYGLLITDAPLPSPPPPPASSSSGISPWNAYLDSRGGARTAAGNKKLSQTKQLALVRWLDLFLELESARCVSFRSIASQDSIDFNSLIRSHSDQLQIAGLSFRACIYRLVVPLCVGPKD